VRVGKLRSQLASQGLNASIPDTHIAQCALDNEGFLLSHDQVFKKMALMVPLKLMVN
jgi:predicted nucleic acid-binding protein